MYIYVLDSVRGRIGSLFSGNGLRHKKQRGSGFVSMDGRQHSRDTDSSGAYTLAAIWAPPFACTAIMEQQTIRDHNSPNLLQLLT